jgi:hypothetical protein
MMVFTLLRKCRPKALGDAFGRLFFARARGLTGMSADYADARERALMDVRGREVTGGSARRFVQTLRGNYTRLGARQRFSGA